MVALVQFVTDDCDKTVSFQILSDLLIRLRIELPIGVMHCEQSYLAHNPN